MVQPTHPSPETHTVTAKHARAFKVLVKAAVAQQWRVDEKAVNADSQPHRSRWRPMRDLAANQTQRRLIAAALITALCVASVLAYRWIRRDITYWSRSVTVEYETYSLEACVRLVVAGMPDVSVVSLGPPVSLRVPEQEGVIVKDTPDPKVARIVVFGHSESVSYLGPASEEPVAAVLHELKTEMSGRCTQPKF